jgi:excisionase family DNA binding protein
MTKAKFTRSTPAQLAELTTEPLLTTKEAAAKLQVSLRTVQLWCESGILSYHRTPGGHRRIPFSAVTAMFNARSSMPTTSSEARRGAFLAFMMRTQKIDPLWDTKTGTFNSKQVQDQFKAYEYGVRMGALANGRFTEEGSNAD